MAFRKMRQKRYAGIYEYYNPNSTDKEILAYYVSYRDADGKPKKIKAVENGKPIYEPSEALNFLNMKKAEVIRLKKELKNDSSSFERKLRHNKLTLNEMANLFFDNRTTSNNILEKRAFMHHLSPVRLENTSSTLGLLKVNMITTEMLLSIRNKLRLEGNIGEKTIDNLYGVLSSMFNEGLRERNQWCLKNPLKDKSLTKLTKSNDNARRRIFSTEELDLLFLKAQYNERLYFFYKLTYHTAARPDAIMSLQVKDIDMTHNRIDLKAMKGATAYGLPITNEITKLVKNWIDKNDLNSDDHYLFYPRKADERYPLEERKLKQARYDYIRGLSQELMDSLFNTRPDGTIISDRKYRASVYTLRHTAATMLVQKYGIHAVKNFLNHADIRTTEIYVKLTDEVKESMANTL